MARAFNKYCSICGNPSKSGLYCDKHDDYSNHPSRLHRKYCTACGTQLSIDNDDDECSSCQEEEIRVNERMREIADDYNSRKEEDTNEWKWATCPNCALYTIHVRLWRRTSDFWDNISGGITSTSYKLDLMRCENCGMSHDI